MPSKKVGANERKVACLVQTWNIVAAAVVKCKSDRGNLTEDISGQPVAGGFHCWLKFYLEEARTHFLTRAITDSDSSDPGRSEARRDILDIFITMPKRA